MAFDPWLEMKREYESLNGPGKLWVQEIEKLAQQVVNKKIFERLPPSVFGFPAWERDELVQMVITERLIGRNQARYIFDTADSIDDARKILRTEINFALADCRVPNQVDNVWNQLEPILTGLGWKPADLGQVDLDSLENQVTRIILSQKRLRNRGTQRFSPLFAGPILQAMAQEIMGLNPGLPSKLILSALRAALTIISPALSIEDVDGIEESPQIHRMSATTGEEKLRMERAQYGSERHEIAMDICEKLDEETLEIIFQKANGATQSEIGAVIGVTRQTAKDRIKAAEVKLLNVLLPLELDSDEYQDVLGAVLDLLGVKDNGVLA